MPRPVAVDAVTAPSASASSTERRSGPREPRAPAGEQEWSLRPARICAQAGEQVGIGVEAGSGRRSVGTIRLDGAPASCEVVRNREYDRGTFVDGALQGLDRARGGGAIHDDRRTRRRPRRSRPDRRPRADDPDVGASPTTSTIGDRACTASASGVIAFVNPAPYVTVATAMRPLARAYASAAATAPASCRTAVYFTPVSMSSSRKYALPFPISPNTSEHVFGHCSRYLAGHRDHEFPSSSKSIAK